jgi:hypothetical protein
MKKIILSLTIGLIVSNLVQGQIEKTALPLNRKVSNEEIRSLKQHHTGAVNRDLIQDLYIDYSFVDNFLQATTSTSQSSFVWRFNSRNTAIDTALSFVGVKFFEVTGYTDPADGANSYIDPISYAANFEMVIDSIFTLLSHENNTGENDSLILQVRFLRLTVHL